MAKTNTKKKTTSKKQKRGTTQVKKRKSSQLKRKTPKQTPQNTKRIPKARGRTGARYGAGLAPARERMIDPTIQSIKKRPKTASPPFAPPPTPSIT